MRERAEGGGLFYTSFLSKVYQKEKVSSFGPVDEENVKGYCWRGVGTEKRKTATESKDVYVFWVFVALQLLGVCVWMDSVLSFQEKGGAIRRVDRKL